MSIIIIPNCCPCRRKYFFLGVVCVLTLEYFGFFAHFFEKEFTTNFTYPYNGDLSSSIIKLEQGLKPDIAPINVYNFEYLSSCSNKCKYSENLRLVYIVKSSLENFERRKMIRKTWGFEKRFSDVPIRTVFILGTTTNFEISGLINEEIKKYNDIVQINFIDTYYNNTIKTMGAIKWVTEHCPNSKFYFFSDDDMYVSTKNVLRFLRNPVNYPDYLRLEHKFLVSKARINRYRLLSKENKIINKYSANMELPENVILFAGFVFISSPLRHRSSKWYVSIKEYPYNLWPPYVTAGAFVLSKQALLKMYYTSFYTKHFRFDDIYLGLVALKAGIEPFHCDEFHYYKKKYNSHSYQYVIASHGYENVDELLEVWSKEKEAGNA